MPESTPARVILVDHSSAMSTVLPLLSVLFHEVLVAHEKDSQAFTLLFILTPGSLILLLQTLEHLNSYE